jgi:hypothetical protein
VAYGIGALPAAICAATGRALRWAGGAQQEHSGAVAEHDEGDGLAGCGAVEDVREEQSGLGGAGVADRRGEVRGHRLGTCARRPPYRRARACVQAGDDEVVDRPAVQPRLVEGGGERLVREGHVDLLGEALLPDPGGGSAGQPPAFEDLVADRVVGEEFGDDGGSVAVAAEDERRRAVAARDLVAAAGQAGAQVGQDRQGRYRGAGGGDQRAETGAYGAGHVDGEHVLVEAERGVDRGRVRLVQVGGCGGGQEELADAVAQAVAGQCGAGRLDGHGRGVLVVARDRPSPLGRRGPQCRGDVGSREAVVRHVGAVCDESGHQRPPGAWLPVRSKMAARPCPPPRHMVSRP